MMRLGKLLVVGIVVELMSFSACSLAQDRSPPSSGGSSDANALASASVRSSTIQDVLTAMQLADIQAVSRIYLTSKDPVVHVFSAMALERMHFDLQAASEHARVCEQSLSELRPAIALACGRFEAGDLMLSGRGADSFAKQHQLIEQYANKGLDQALAGMRAYGAAHAEDPGLMVVVPPQGALIATDPNRWSPSFHASVGGKDVQMMLDTGASDLVLARSEAVRLGVKLLGEGTNVSGWLSSGLQGERGILNELSVGGITWRNIPVTVLPTTPNLLGGNLIAPLGTLKISKGSLTIFAENAQPPACTTPMLTASNLQGREFRLIPQLPINGIPHSVMLDTGSHQYLLGTRGALDEAETLHRGKLVMRDIGGTHPFANIQAAKVRLLISGQPIDIYFAAFVDSKMPWSFTLGAGALRDMDFLLDFKRQHQCFLIHPGLR